MDTRSSDEAQRARLARILGDPAAYFADARRRAHDRARELLTARLDAPHLQPR